MSAKYGFIEGGFYKQSNYLDILGLLCAAEAADIAEKKLKDTDEADGGLTGRCLNDGRSDSTNLDLKTDNPDRPV